MARTVYTTDEGTTPVYSFQMTDSADASTIPESSLLTLTLTYYNLVDGTIINSRTAQDIKDANDVVVSTAGLVTWGLVVADTAISDIAITEVGEYEVHRALFQWTYTSTDSTTKSGKDEIDIRILNLGKVT